MGARWGKMLLNESIMPKTTHDAAVRYYIDWEHDALPASGQAFRASGGLDAAVYARASSLGS